MDFWTKPSAIFNKFWRPKTQDVRQIRHFYSPILDREVDIDIYLPPNYAKSTAHYPLVVFNDGQDLAAMGFNTILTQLYRDKKIPHIIVAGIYCHPHDRIREYGTATRPDYKGRGDKAGIYRDFILQEMLSYFHSRFRVDGFRRNTIFAGFSLGALSAIDIAYATKHVFGIVGIFSGALWWRYSDNPPAHDPDAGRIMHDIIQNSSGWDGKQRFYFQTGTRDETDDRNHNGVIDSIDDTIDLIRELKRKGTSDEAIVYHEIQDGQHNIHTWAAAMPHFLTWAFDKRLNSMPKT